MIHVNFGQYDREAINRLFGAPNDIINDNLPFIWNNLVATIGEKKYPYNAKASTCNKHNQVYVELLLDSTYKQEQVKKIVKDVRIEADILEYAVKGERNGDFERE